MQRDHSQATVGSSVSIVTDSSESMYFTDAHSHFTDSETESQLTNDNDFDQAELQQPSFVADQTSPSALSPQVTIVDQAENNSQSIPEPQTTRDTNTAAITPPQEQANPTTVSEKDLNRAVDINQQDTTTPPSQSNVITVQPPQEPEPTLEAQTENKDDIEEPKAFIATNEDRKSASSAHSGDARSARGYQRDESECHEYYCSYEYCSVMQPDKESGENIFVMCSTCCITSLVSVFTALCTSK